MQKKSVKKPTKDAQELQAWLGNLPFKDYNNVIRTIVDCSGITIDTLKGYRFSRTLVPLGRKMVLNAVAVAISGSEIFDLSEFKEKLNAINVGQG